MAQYHFYRCQHTPNFFQCLRFDLRHYFSETGNMHVTARNFCGKQIFFNVVSDTYSTLRFINVSKLENINSCIILNRIFDVSKTCYLLRVD